MEVSDPLKPVKVLLLKLDRTFGTDLFTCLSAGSKLGSLGYEGRAIPVQSLKEEIIQGDMAAGNIQFVRVNILVGAPFVK
jgi:hypothetical protein